MLFEAQLIDYTTQYYIINHRIIEKNRDKIFPSRKWRKSKRRTKRKWGRDRRKKRMDEHYREKQS